MWRVCIGLMVLCCTSLAYANMEGYEGYKKYTIQHNDEDVYQYMVDLQTNDTNLDFWLLTRNVSIVAVAPFMQPILESQLESLGAPYIAKSLMDEMILDDDTDCDGSLCPLNRKTRQAGGFFRHYPRYDSIIQYMNALALRHPQFARLEVLGRSVEGRIIAGLSISLNGRRDRKVAYIQGGTHGREWITTPTVLYFAAEILANINAFRSILRDTEIYVVPLMNPDGYEYSHTGDRFWRKNRHRFSLRSCVGVDINRNFGHYWNYKGSSQNHCSEVYSGLRPNSEPETQAVKRFLDRNRNRVKLVLDVHSFGKFLFYPYGFTKAAAPTRNLLHSVAVRAASQIAKYRGTVYTIGSSSNILYEASGGLDDYAYGALGIPLTYTLELPGNGFDYPASDLIHVCKETFAGYIEFVRHVSLF
ncbi:carboxypeptidase B [Eupeodes corollae]|uniref:carboxypeptidase B n=1 Tax=Eupeodes corollae TaxID=290404 RepID=UPI0024934507|nr:carboxypeptidase B [Eupeodes corollae]